MLWIWAGSLVVLVSAVYFDVKERRIPNRLIILSLLVFPALVVLSNGFSFDIIKAHLLTALIVFSVGLVFWLTGWMGAGDVKLLGVLGILFPVHQAGILLINVALAGLVLAGVIWPVVRYLHDAARRRRARLTSVDVDNSVALEIAAEQTEAQKEIQIETKRGLPYAVAIAAGGITTLMGLSPLPP